MEASPKPAAPGPATEPDAVEHAYRKAGRLLVVVLALYGVLVATHDGEFWPFSIYQMFSSAGQPWTRVIVREVPALPPARTRWTEEGIEDLPARAFALRDHGVPQNDVVAYVAQTARWTPTRRDGLRALLGYTHTATRILAVYRVDGMLEPESTIDVTCTPLLYLTPDTVLANPHFDPDARP